MIRLIIRKIGWGLGCFGNAMWDWGMQPVYEYEKSRADHPAGKGL